MCFQHSVAWHDDQTCAQYDSVKAHGDPDYQKTTDWIKKNTKPCPKCRRNIQKGEMCFHMTCKPPSSSSRPPKHPENRTWLTNDRLAVHARVLLGVPGGLGKHRPRAWPVQCKCPPHRVSVPHERDSAHAHIGRDIRSGDAATTSMMGRRSFPAYLFCLVSGPDIPRPCIGPGVGVVSGSMAGPKMQYRSFILMKKQCCFTRRRLPRVDHCPARGSKRRRQSNRAAWRDAAAPQGQLGGRRSALSP